MINLLKKVKINPLFWFVIGAGALSGYFREILIVFMIVFIHEMGHSIAAHFFNWRIRKIELLPFGGVAEVEENGNRPLKEEFIVIIAGPVQHIWLIGLSYLFVSFDFWTTNDHIMFVTHNLMILCFNLLPIMPLDGGKLLHLLFSLKFPYLKAHRKALKTSFLLLLVFAVISIYIFPFHLNLWVIILFLLFSHYFEWKQRNFSYMRFLIERLAQKETPLRSSVPIIVSPHSTVQDVLKRFQRGVKHTIIVKDLTMTSELYEKDVLEAFFHQKKIHSPIASIRR